MVALIFLGATLLCVVGWQVFFFLTDDAFIAFRYVSNRHLGYGYTWNAPPFLPVEGYTSFLWVVLLDAVWSLTGITPPVAANLLSLLFSIGSLLVVAVLTQELVRGPRRESGLPALLSLVLLVIVTNRTFLAWTSSGLETALFNFLLHVWLLLMLLRPRERAWPSALLALDTALLSLARPDGYLFLAATGLILGVEAWRRRDLLSRRFAAAAAPLLVVPIHVLWRRSFYGEWLPNTYYAKVVGVWPEAGVRYLGSFALEYALWFWVVFVGAAVVHRFRHPPPSGELPPSAGRSMRPVVALSTLGLHFLYYTLVVGGDHFEYRAYSHLIPPLALTLLWAVLALQMSTRAAVATLSAFVLLSGVIPWTHWAASQGLVTREETRMMRVPVAERLPLPFRLPATAFDALQDWLIQRHVGARHQEHKVFARLMLRSLPRRAAGSRFLEGEENPVVAAPSVGVVAWVFPHVHVIDMLGLNDYVIARGAVRADAERLMAHDRLAPEGYVEAFRPNLLVDAFGHARAFRRGAPLTDEEIRTIEARFRAAVDAGDGS